MSAPSDAADAEWLEKLGLGQYEAAFENDIDETVLPA